MNIFREVSMMLNCIRYENSKPPAATSDHPVIEVNTRVIKSNKQDIIPLLQAYYTELQDMIELADDINIQSQLAKNSKSKQLQLQLKYSRLIRQAEQLRLKIQTIESKYK